MDAQRKRRWRADVVSIVIFLALAAVVVTSSVYGYTRVSVFDESTHIDQAYRLSRFDVVRRGDTLTQFALEEWACRGFFDPQARFPQCGDAPYEPTSFPAEGINYNEFHPPLYYAITGLSARVVVAVTPIQSFVLGARLMGIAWLAAGMYALYRLALAVGISRKTSRLVACVPALLSTVIHLYSTVNNDATTLLGGAAIGLVGLAVYRNQIHPALAGVVAALAASGKVTNGLAVVVILCLFSIVGWHERADVDLRRRLLLGGAAMVIGVAFVQLGWGLVQDLRAPDGEYVSPVRGVAGEISETFPFMGILGNVTKFMPPTATPYIPPAVEGSSVNAWLAISTWALGAAPLALALMAPARTLSRRLGVAVLAGAAVSVFVVGVQYWLDFESFHRRMNPRYGLALLPLILVCLGWAADQHRGGRWALGGFVALGAVLVIPSLLLAL